MKLEDIEKRWTLSAACNIECEESAWAFEYAEKLLAVAKAASNVVEMTRFISFSGQGALIHALKELEKDDET